MKSYLAFFIIAVMGVIASPSYAQRSDSIAAVVNGDVITYTDLYDRMSLILKSSGMPDTKEFKARLLPQVLTGLITEQIQLQEAKKLGFSVSSDEIGKGFAELAGQNRLKPEQFKSILKQQNVQITTLEKQIESQLAWGKVVQKEIRPRIALSDGDIDAEVARLERKEGQEEFFVAEIFMPVNDNAAESDVRKAATNLSKQLKQDIKKFPAAARQFSQSSTAANGGIIGWITADQLDEDIELALSKMDKQQVSSAIKNDDGYTILFVRDKRTIDLGSAQIEEKLRIKMAVFEIPENQSDRNTLNDVVDDFRRDVKGCLDILKRTTKMDNVRLDEVDEVLNNIPSDIKNAIADINIGEVGTNITTEIHITVPMLCGRDGGGENTALKREIENRMGTQRMDILQKRYLRDLISDAYIERRV
jgi:peptidyl-prolyl cis-trans isomerase SurA